MTLPYRSRVFSLFGAACVAVVSAAAQPKWTPIADTVYLQESGSQITTAKPVFAVGVLKDEIFAGFGDGIKKLVDRQRLEPVEGAPPEYVLRMRTLGDSLWIVTKKGLHQLKDGRCALRANGEFSDVCGFNGKTVAASGGMLYLFDDAGMTPLSPEPAPGSIMALTVHAETVYCMGGDRVFLFDGKQFVTDKRGTVEFGSFASKDLREALSFGNQLVVAAHNSLGVLRGTAATSILAADGLPWEECLGLAPGFDNDYWVATTKGAIRQKDGAFQYFCGGRWLPDDHVNAVACGTNFVCLATNKGLGVINYEPFTLQKKADYYERHLEEWGQKRMVFTHKLEPGAGPNGWMREVSDNDVGWSTHYWAAQAFKYAATGDEKARQAAIDGFNALKWSEEISGIPGFPARSIWAVGENSHQTSGGSGGYAAEWHPTEDGKWEWKGDTSSDETDAQFYYAWVFYSLVADEPLREKVREHVSRICDHLMNNNWTLCDVDGKPTVWGRWDEEYFRGKGRYAKGLNGLEILTYHRVTHKITGNQRYLDAYNELIGKGYADEVIHQKHAGKGFAVNHSDDRLAFYNYHTLLQVEDDPALRGIYRRSLERSWEIERIEQVPWFNFIYGALTGNDCETAQAVGHLREWPLDLVRHPYDHSHRRDIHPPRGTLPYSDVEKALSPRETNPGRWTRGQGQLQEGGGEVVDPAGWLDAYWMGRYYGMIAPPQTEDPALLSVPRRGLQLGAPPYNGPAMPDILD